MEGVSKTTIAHEIGGINDSLRFGLQGVRSEIVGSKMTEAEMKRKFLETTYGSAFPLKMDLDSRMLSRFQRPPGALPSSMLGYEAVTGSLDDFGFEDFHCINDPCESETFRPVDMHHGMEVRLGLSNGPVCPSFI
ncbi:Proteasome maturation factor UMP1 [Macleaya cordata]|uniref:Proteasome maturation factor UMP1 n=1 Tax=Macleaya cordata TaxID=56857 RepID=A0A200Q8K9_MACCD|nr:Proteasome maturation factor UMP1 [Macleaya cordata]